MDPPRLTPLPPLMAERPRLPVGAGRNGGRRRFSPRLIVSALLHLAPLLALLLWHWPDEPGAVSPPSFQMVWAPAGPQAAPLRAPPEPPQPEAAPPAPQPAAAPRNQVPPPVRITLADPLPETPAPDSAFVVPPAPPPAEPAPPPPRPAAAPPHPAPAKREPAFPAPMDTSLGLAGAHGTSGMDTSPEAGTADSRLSAPRDESAAEGMIHVRGGHLSKAWQEQLYEWWLVHSFYPKEALRHEQDGTVKIHIRVNRDGTVTLVGLDRTSGSVWLDSGAQAVFRDQTVPAFPDDSPDMQDDVDITIEYKLVRH